MLIKLTEFDGDSLVINSASIAFIRPCKTKNVKARSFVQLLSDSKEYDNSFYVKESIEEILNKVSAMPLF